MIEIQETDFVSLAEFPLRWRFGDPRLAQLSPERLRRIRPLSSAAAAGVDARATARCGEGKRFTVTFRSDDEPAEVRRRLRELPLDDHCRILVSWDARTAALTEWELFVTHWDDFCYPSSDDVTVVPLAEGWTLCYRHYDVFQFGADPVSEARRTTTPSP